MKIIVFMLSFITALLIILIILKNNQIIKMQRDIQNLKEELVEVRGVIYR